MDVDFLSVSGHKIYAPKGCGALYIKKGTRFRPVTFGGGQEKNVRPGTEGIANACAMGLSASLLMQEREENHKRITQIRDALLEGLTNLPDICINSPADATPYILNFSALGVRSEIMLHFLEEKGIYVSSGSACAKGGQVCARLDGNGSPACGQCNPVELWKIQYAGRSSRIFAGFAGRPESVSKIIHRNSRVRGVT